MCVSARTAMLVGGGEAGWSGTGGGEAGGTETGGGAGVRENGTG